MPNINLYKKSLKWLEDLNQNKIVPGLERIQKIMKLLGNPQDRLRVISIGGTNAKGSTSYNLSKTLMQSGKKIVLRFGIAHGRRFFCVFYKKNDDFLTKIDNKTNKKKRKLKQKNL